MVDDRSADDTAAAVAAIQTEAVHPRVRLLHGEGRGPNAARNLGLDAMEASLAVFVDDDVEAPPGWLRALVGGAERNPGAGCLGGPVRLRLESSAPRLCGSCLLGETELDLGDEERPVEDGFPIPSANMLVTAHALQLIGPFDEELPIYFEETEWQHRLKRAGLPIVYIPQAWLWHRRTADDLRLTRLMRKHFRFGYGEVAFRKAIGEPISLRQALRRSLGIPGLLRHALFSRCARGLISTAGQLGQLYGVARGKVADAREAR